MNSIARHCAHTHKMNKNTSSIAKPHAKSYFFLHFSLCNATLTRTSIGCNVQLEHYGNKKRQKEHNFMRTYINRTNYFTTSHHLFTHSLFRFRVSSSLCPGIIRNCLVCEREREKKQFSQFAHP
jgi:hypothetical protein